MFCGKCGKQNVDGVVFCVHCGVDLSRMTPPPDSLSDTPTMAGPEQPTTEDEMSIGDTPTIAEPVQWSPANEVSIGDTPTIVSATGNLVSVGQRFEIIEELGRGGMGEVYKADDRKLGRTVALKSLHAHSADSKKAIERFWREAKVVASLNHFNIVQVYDVLEDGHKLWIVMEYVSGGSLQEKLDKQVVLDAEQVRQIGIQIAGALSVAHEKGIFHRDIKPANILLTDKGTPKLGDFGLARQSDGQAQMTIAGSQMGTMYYAAPEQMTSGCNVDVRSDIYGLGATLYALTTGEPPRSIRLERVDKSLRDIIGKCLEEHPDKRYPTAAALIDALQAGAKPSVFSSDVGCPSCGHTNPIDVKFCQKCGGDLSSLFSKCPKCQRENRKDIEFCGICGLNLRAYDTFWKEYNAKKNKFSLEEATEFMKLGCEQFAWDKETENEFNHLKDVKAKIVCFIQDAKKVLEEGNYLLLLELYDRGDEYLKSNTDILTLKRCAEKIKQAHFIANIKDALEHGHYMSALEKCNEVVADKHTNPEIQQLLQQAEKLKQEHLYDWEVFNQKYYSTPGEAVEALRLLKSKYPWDEKIDAKITEQRNIVHNAITLKAIKFFMCGLLVGIILFLYLISHGLGIHLASEVGLGIVLFFTIFVVRFYAVRSNQLYSLVSFAYAHLVQERNSISIPSCPFVGQVITNSIGIKLVYIPPGKYTMGSTGGDFDEKPARQVTLSKGFWLGRFEVTQAQYHALMGSNLCYFKGSNLPVEMVSWFDATEFCRKLSNKEDISYCLPTEAQWEYACRAGSTTVNSFGDNEGRLEEHAWYNKNSNNTTHSIGQKKPNSWGLYDMHGNVWEWCSDWYQDSYNELPDKDPKGPQTGVYRVLRGGSWLNDYHCCRTASRGRTAPCDKDFITGFRVCLLSD